MNSVTVDIPGYRPVQIRSLSKREMERISYMAEDRMAKQKSLVLLAGIEDDPHLGEMSPEEINAELEAYAETDLAETLLCAVIDFSEPFRLSKHLK